MIEMGQEGYGHAGTTEYLFTLGAWSTEQESVAALDAILAAHAHLWSVYSEVCGTPTQVRPCQVERANLRIDRILVPKPALIDLGWTHGVIGIEAKRSGIKAGPALSQAIDYLRTAWRLPPSRVHIWVDWVFVWPLPKVGGTVASIMAQQRVGSANTSRYAPLHLASGESSILRIDRNGNVTVGACNTGTRNGSR
jgi:hypothetical protein